MSQALQFVPPRVAFVDPRTGMITREWLLFLQAIFLRVGGSQGSSTTDITAQLSALSDSLSVQPAYQQDPPSPDAAYDLAADLASLRAELDCLRQQIQSIQQGTAT
jgi:hypothetical protein